MRRLNGFRSAFALAASGLLPVGQLLLVLLLGRLGIVGGDRLLQVLDDRAPARGTASWAFTLVQAWIGVPPQEELISPTGTSSCLCSSRPKK